MNAANEVCVAAFLNGTIGFLDIAAVVERVLARYSPQTPASIDEVIAIDAEARIHAAEAMETSPA